MISNGSNANTWEGNWIPNICRFKLLTHNPLLPRENGVRDFMDKEKFCWDSSSINSMFIPLDRENILNITFHTFDEDDTLVGWLTRMVTIMLNLLL